MTTVTYTTPELVGELVSLVRIGQEEWSLFEANIGTEEGDAWKAAWKATVEAADRTRLRLYQSMKREALVQAVSGPFKARIEHHDSKAFIALYRQEEDREVRID